MKLIDFFNGNAGVLIHRCLMTRTNKKRFQRYLKAAQARGFENQFYKAWRDEGGEDREWGLQTGLESLRAYRRAQAAFQGNLKA